MPEYPVFEVQLLLEALANNAGVRSFDKRGFEIISEGFNKDTSPTGVEITSRYLKEQIFDKLNKALAAKEVKVSYSQDYIDTLTDHLHFNSFTTFQRAVKNIQKTLTKLEINRNADYEIAIVHHGDEPTNLEEIRRLLESSDFKVLWLDVKEKEEVKQQLENVALTIILLSNKLTLNLLKSNLPANIAKPKAPFLLYDPAASTLSINPTLPSEWQAKPVLDQSSLSILLGLLQVIIETNHPVEKLQKMDEVPSVSSRDAGTVIQGDNTRIKGKYVSGRDMHIVINKHKKND